MSDTTHHIGFLRGNPFTSAHAAFAEHIKTEADKQGAGHTVVLTRSHDAKKNPLSPEQKLKHAQRAAPDVNFTVASGLTNGSAGSIAVATTSGYLAWSAEL